MSSLCHGNHKPCACATFITASITLTAVHGAPGSGRCRCWGSCCHLEVLSQTATFCVKLEEKHNSEPAAPQSASKSPQLLP